MKIIDLDLHRLPAVSSKAFLPGDHITVPETSLQGPGTILIKDQLYASYLGEVQINDNFTKQTPAVCSFYQSDHNDVVIGRVSAIRQGTWLVNIGSTKLLPLSIDNINLPGLLRQRSSADESNMRQWLKEGDCICLEVVKHKSSQRGLTRNAKFGKLSYGYPVMFNPSKLRGDQLTKAGSTDVILGSNGIAWICFDRANCMESVFDGSKSVLTEEEIQTVIKVQQAIQVLNQGEGEISQAAINDQLTKMLSDGQ